MGIQFLTYILACLILTPYVLAFRNGGRIIKMHNSTKVNVKQLGWVGDTKGRRREVGTSGGKLFYSLNKTTRTNIKIRHSHVHLSLKEKINFIFHGESDVTLLDKLIASTSYVLPFMDAIQAFVMPLVNMLPPSLHNQAGTNAGTNSGTNAGTNVDTNADTNSCTNADTHPPPGTSSKSKN
ncbi:hypothetical protein PCYB_095030 [Plasmodium cynomolgi strain B]|uniref:Uncharacterized protein n=1 Tax=Plasmodium cynomolgi (strain B) TaxID=1120755 RepID=K6UTQ9_PLACD|nr:hypothetical protein PCYB_095030 [Plasmodium cynomolgi strain B]GAB66719.1 hypothetical protein PCYB_095030 [Plasmodium cynomolgi strain B]